VANQTAEHGRRDAAFIEGVDMKYLFAAALAVITAASFADAANAAQGCGPGWHRGAYGRCVPNRGAVVVRPAPVVVVRPAPRVVVVPRARVCPYGMVWRYGRCRY
jgi:hypothetical protein